ncbi:MAG: hypothetical protein RL397_1914 [Pseudomonadota bacterium]|jgi:hypothetical protein
MASAAVLVGICLALESALPGANPDSPPLRAEDVAASVFLVASTFTLAWTHSIEKQRWEEDYAPAAAEDGSNSLWLRPLAARIKGSGAGMEPPDDSRLVNGWFVYRPTTAPLRSLRLTRSFFTDDYSLCIDNRCVSMATILPSDGQTTRLWGCTKKSPP